MKKFVLFAAFAFIFGSCKKAIDWQDIFHHGSKSETFSGPQVKMGAGKARSWITISQNGIPSEIGVELTDDVLSGLPDTNFSVAIPFPIKAKESTPCDHLDITWASHGHPLPGTSIAPHFDVRFFMTSLGDHLSIPAYAADSAGFNNHPPAGYMPESYFPYAPVPQAGLHWTEKTYTDPVTKALILGSYNGKFTFVAPIMILDVLKEGQSYSSSYAQPQYFPKTNTYYPTKYNIYIDNDTKKHFITLSGFVLRYL